MTDAEKIVQLETKIGHLEDRVTELGGFIKEIRELSANVATLSTKVQMTLDELGKQESRIIKLEDADADKWRSAIKYGLSALIGGVITYILNGGGLN